jgi:hypothetical protein
MLSRMAPSCPWTAQGPWAVRASASGVGLAVVLGSEVSEEIDVVEGRAPALVRACAACVCLVVVLAACSGAGTGVAASGAAPNSAPAATPSPPSAAVAADSPSSAIATVDIPISFIDKGTLQVAVTGMDVVGNLMRLRLTFTANVPSASQEVAIGSVLAGDDTYPATAISPELIDPVHLKSYEAVISVPNGTKIDLIAGEPRTLEFYYAAPQDDIQTFDIILSSQTPSITDVPFTA